MTAGAATIVAALHVSDRIKDYGSYAGFACVLGLAVLALLYFAQAREVKRLREWAGRAPERDAELQARVTAEAQQRAAGPPAAAKPAAAAATPAGQAAAAKPTTPGATPATAPATPGQPQPAAKPGQPAQPPAAQPSAPKPGVPAPATAAAAAAGAASASPATTKPDAPTDGDGASATPPPSTPTPATPSGANGAVEQPTQITPAPADAAASAPKPTPKPGQPLQPPAPKQPVAAGGDEHSPLRATLIIIGGVLGVIAVVLVLVFVVFSGDDNKKTPNKIGNTPATTTDDSSNTGTSNGSKTEPVSRGDVRVAVLNGTTVPGLARGAATKLQTAGFQIGTVTNAPDQARSATVVAYQPGHQNEARVVARLIDVGADAVKPIDQSTAVVAGQDAFVVVTVGADQSQ